ncbi:MAG: hypothetical protein GY786_10110 [Proteobacteria bacterium]|nr:hypothetical protein [Pseudomonadota bacterium]
MLRFHGIRFDQQGKPERYTSTTGLLETLNTGLYLHKCFQGEQKKVLKAIELEIDQVYQPVGGRNQNKTDLRQKAAKGFRKREIMRFIYRDSGYLELKLAVARILITPADIEPKWEKIQWLLMEYVYPLSSNARENLICNGNSEFFKIMQMVTLFFLEQNDDIPPANLELQFVRNQFPKVIWKKREAIHSDEDPFWQPRSPLCKVTYLVARILSSCFEEEKKGLLIPQSDTKPITDDNLLPKIPPSNIEICRANEDQQEQLFTLPEQVPETLLSIQKQIQKEFSHEGVKHFLAILRQFSENRNPICSFSRFKHLKLVAKLDKRGQSTEHQKKLFKSILKRLSEMEVTRSWTDLDEPYSVTTPFILKTGSTRVLGDESSSTIEYKLDPMFELNRDNPYLLGQHLQLIPEKLFNESSHKHAYIAGIASYLTGTWLYEANQHLSPVQKTARQIIEGCAFNITSSNRYRTRIKLNSELKYMSQKSYIGKMELKYSSKGNPWEDIYEISPPEYYCEKLTPMLAMNQQRLCG